MSTVAVGSIKGAPGVTTTVLAMAAVWPAAEPVLVAELDPDGGVLAARRGLGFEPGLVSLVAALLRGTGDAGAHTQPLNDGAARALVAPSAAEQVRVSLAAAGGALWPALSAAYDGNVLIDCGRLSAASATVGVASEADTALIVARPRLEDVALARDQVPALRQVDVDPLIVLTDDGPYRTDDVADALGAPVVARLPIDRRAADALNGVGAHPRLAHSRLLRSVRHLLADLRERPSERRPTAKSDRPVVHGDCPAASDASAFGSEPDATRTRNRGQEPGTAGRPVHGRTHTAADMPVRSDRPIMAPPRWHNPEMGTP